MSRKKEKQYDEMPTINADDLPFKIKKKTKNTDRRRKQRLKCKWCGTHTNSRGEVFSDNRAVRLHEAHCSENPDRNVSFGATLKSWKEKGHTIENGKVKCKWCGKIFDAHGMISHSNFHKKDKGNGKKRETNKNDKSSDPSDLVVYIKLKAEILEIIDMKKLEHYINKQIAPFSSEISIKLNGEGKK
jgi:hypothetical protein